MQKIEIEIGILRNSYNRLLVFDILYGEDELDRVTELSMEDCWKPTPASKEAVAALGKVVIGGGERESSCAVCLEEFSEGEDASKLPCSHVFHEECIGRWFECSCVCPLCRFELPSS